jgi:hypothetical protein
MPAAEAAIQWLLISCLIQANRARNKRGSQSYTSKQEHAGNQKTRFEQNY